MIHNALVSLLPAFALAAIALLIYLRVLYVRHRGKKAGETRCIAP